MEIKSGIYKHYKGNEYIIIGTGLDTSTNLPIFIYKSINKNDYSFFSRPISEFDDIVENDKGEKVKRFEFIREHIIFLNACDVKKFTLNDNELLHVIVDAEKFSSHRDVNLFVSQLRLAIQRANPVLLDKMILSIDDTIKFEVK